MQIVRSQIIFRFLDFEPHLLAAFPILVVDLNFVVEHKVEPVVIDINVVVVVVDSTVNLGGPQG